MRFYVISGFWQTLSCSLVDFLKKKLLTVWESNLHCATVPTHMWIKPKLINSRCYFQRKFHLEDRGLDSVHGRTARGEGEAADVTLQTARNCAHLMWSRYNPGTRASGDGVSPSRDVLFCLIRDTETRKETEHEEINGNMCFQQIREEFH